MKTAFALCPVLASLAILCGCGGGEEGPQTVPVSGTVTLDGKPLEEGTITFKDVAGADKTYAGKIVDGEFSFPSTVGQKRVEIGSLQVTHKTSGPGDPGTPGDPPSAQNPIVVSTELVPARYNTNSELTANVESGGENNFKFDLNSQP